MCLCYFLRLSSPLLLNLTSLNFMETFALLLTCGRKKKGHAYSSLSIRRFWGKRGKMPSKISSPPPPPPLGRPDTLAMPAYSVVSMHAHKIPGDNVIFAVRVSSFQKYNGYSDT